MAEFNIRWSKRAEKNLSKLSKEIARQVVHKVDSLRENPFRHLEHYSGGECYKLRIGEYRALIDVFFREMILHVRILEHRKKIYKRKK